MTAHPTNRPNDASIERGILARLHRDGALPRDAFADQDAIDRLYSQKLILILSDGRIGLSLAGARLVNKPAVAITSVPETPEEYPPPMRLQPDEPPVSKAAAAILRQVADAGGATKPWNGIAWRSIKQLYDAHLLKKSVDRHGARISITPAGTRWLDQHPTAPAPVETPPVEVPLDDDDVPREALTASSPLSIADSANGFARAAQATPNGVQAFAEALNTFSIDTRDGIAALDHALGDVYDDNWQRCEICPSGSPHCVNLRVLDFLLEHAPALRPIYDHLVQLEADRARLAETLNALGA